MSEKKVYKITRPNGTYRWTYSWQKDGLLVGEVYEDEFGAERYHGYPGVPQSYHPHTTEKWTHWLSLID